MYCLDAQFASDVAKFVAGSLQALSAMVLLELPHLNVLTKVDLLTPDSKVRYITLATDLPTWLGAMSLTKNLVLYIIF